MNEAPKKIWLADYQLRDVATWEWEGGTPYIRADIVDELVEALEKTAELVEILGHPAAKARAALSKARGEG